MLTGKILVLLLTMILVPWLLRAMTSGHLQARSRGQGLMCEYGPAYLACLWCGFVFFALLGVLAVKFPGRTSPEGLKWALLIFAFFSLMSLVGLVLAWRSVLLFDERGVEGADMLGRRHRLDWGELDRVEYVPSNMALRLLSSDGRTVWVSQMMRGYEDFRAELERRGIGVLED